MRISCRITVERIYYIGSIHIQCTFTITKRILHQYISIFLSIFIHASTAHIFVLLYVIICSMCVFFLSKKHEKQCILFDELGVQEQAYVIYKICCYNIIICVIFVCLLAHAFSGPIRFDFPQVALKFLFQHEHTYT